MTTLTSSRDGLPAAHAAYLPAEDELRRLAGPVFAAVQALGAAMVATDPRRPDNPIVFANAAFTRLTGYLPAQVIGRNCRLLQGPDTDPSTVATVGAAVRAGRAVQARLLNYRSDGAPFWNDLSIAPVLDETGRVAFFLSNQADVTALRRAAEKPPIARN